MTMDLMRKLYKETFKSKLKAAAADDTFSGLALVNKNNVRRNRRVIRKN